MTGAVVHFDMRKVLALFLIGIVPFILSDVVGKRHHVAILGEWPIIVQAQSNADRRDMLVKEERQGCWHERLVQVFEKKAPCIVLIVQNNLILGEEDFCSFLANLAVDGEELQLRRFVLVVVVESRILCGTRANEELR